MKTVLRPVTITILLSLLGFNLAIAGSARNQLSVEPQKIYPRMIEAANAQDWDKLSNALKLLKPLSDEIDQTLGAQVTVELRQAIADKNTALAQKKVIEFITGGIRSLLVLATDEKNEDERKDMFRQAFTEYVVIEPYLKKVDAMTTEQIMNDFRNSYTTIRNQQEFIKSAVIINRQLKSVEGKI